MKVNSPLAWLQHLLMHSSVVGEWLTMRMGREGVSANWGTFICPRRECSGKLHSFIFHGVIHTQSVCFSLMLLLLLLLVSSTNHIWSHWTHLHGMREGGWVETSTQLLIHASPMVLPRRSCWESNESILVSPFSFLRGFQTIPPCEAHKKPNLRFRTLCYFMPFIPWS